MDRPRLSTLDDLRATFGSNRVSAEARRDRVQALFDRIAPQYDLMNDLMSFGLHRRWKRKLVASMAASSLPEGPIIDLAGGTGDLAFGLARALPGRRLVVVDPSAGMLAVARRRSAGEFVTLQAEAEALPFADASVAAVSLSFGLRNMADPGRALAEIARVLKPDGVLALLEFSKVDRWFAPFYGLHARFVIPLLGAAVAGDRAAYRYLVDSIRIFPDADAVTADLARAGLDLITLRRLQFGVAALHLARRRDLSALASRVVRSHKAP